MNRKMVLVLCMAALLVLTVAYLNADEASGAPAATSQSGVDVTSKVQPSLGGKLKATVINAGNASVAVPDGCITPIDTPTALACNAGSCTFEFTMNANVVASAPGVTFAFSPTIDGIKLSLPPNLGQPPTTFYQGYTTTMAAIVIKGSHTVQTLACSLGGTSTLGIYSITYRSYK